MRLTFVISGSLDSPSDSPYYYLLSLSLRPLFCMCCQIEQPTKAGFIGKLHQEYVITLYLSILLMVFWSCRTPVFLISVDFVLSVFEIRTFVEHQIITYHEICPPRLSQCLMPDENFHNQCPLSSFNHVRRDHKVILTHEALPHLFILLYM